MSMPSRVTSVLRNLLRRQRVEQDLDEELRAYVELAVDERRRAGLSEAEARRQALLELGGVDQVKESVRDARSGALADQIRRELFFAVRMMARHPAFTALAVTTLALGIGANTAIFTVVDTVLFRPLPYRDPGRLVKVWERGPSEPTDNVSWADFADLREQNDVFELMAADDGSDVEVGYADGSREPVGGAIVSAGWLATLGVQPVVGRGFLPEESEGGGTAGRGHVAMLSHAYWQRRFSADPRVVGSTLVLDGTPSTIVGVLPPNVLRYGADVLRPLVPASYPRERSHRDLDVIARLKPGVTLAQAQSAVDTIARRLAQDYPATNRTRGFSVAPLGKHYASLERRAQHGLLLMLGAVGLVLLIACANVTNLLLGRAMTRARECAIRAALGASRARLIRQLLIESVVLFLAGGACGLLLASWSVRSLLALSVAGGYVPARMAVEVDGRVFAFSFVLSLIAGVLSGLVPALQASRVDLSERLKASSQTVSGGFRRAWASRLLIVGEIAVSLVLLVGSGLMIRSVARLYATSAGIEAEHLLLAASDGGHDFPAAVTYWRAVLERTRQVPGVQFAGLSSRPPVHGARRQLFAIDGRAHMADDDSSRAGDILISADYFRTTGIGLLKGRAFTEHDHQAAAPVAIVSQSLARRYFPDGDPIGRRVMIQERAPLSCCSAAGPVEGVWREIVGVAADVRQGNLDEAPAMTIYRPYSQIVEHDMFLLVRARSAQDATRIADQLRPYLVAMDPARPWSDVRLMADVIDGSDSIRVRRFVLILLGSFACLALLLAAVGTYGVMAYAVAERTREIGIRVALGATRPVVLREIVGDAMRPTVAGLVIGTVAAYASTRFIATLLFDVSTTDALTYIVVALILAGVALLATLVPARRALRIDPLVALRQE